MKYTLLLLISFLACGFRADDTSFGTRGGGNGTTAEFNRLGNELFSVLLPARAVVVQDQTIDIASLHVVFKSASITVPNIDFTLDNSTVDAFNYPDQKRIEINANNWVMLPLNAKRQLILHEILGLARIPDINYSVSEGLLLKFRALALSNPLVCPLSRYNSGIDALTTHSLLKKFSGAANPILSLEQVTCTVDPWKQATECIAQNGETLKAPADNQLLVAIFKNMGMAASSPDGVIEIYTAGRISCMPSSEPSLTECMFISQWMDGCP
ncbi:hypothetical protein [Bdellovibrio sp. HCB288]|uniref:hypothetical protein n=1 Tax=Bdellovibrio sp. HCB288 TaxID=3394355 RepID=UPI0039B4ED54